MTPQDHKIATRPFHGRVRIMTAGYLIAASTDAIELAETGCAKVYYIPKSDIRMDMIAQSATTSSCPYKGTAGYWNIDAEGVRIADAAWSSETPLTEASMIAGHLAFSPDKIDASESTSAGPA